MGRAALLPGMRYMLEQMQAIVDEFRQTLAALQNGNSVDESQANKPKRGRPPKSGYWASMTPEQRSAEMKRRAEMGRGKAKAKASSFASIKRIDGDYTMAGAAEVVGLGSTASFAQWRVNEPKARKLGRKVPNPTTPSGKPAVLVFAQDEVNKMLKLRGMPVETPQQPSKTAKSQAKAERRSQKRSWANAPSRTNAAYLPERIGDDYTMVGAANALGIKRGSFKDWRKRNGFQKLGRIVSGGAGKMQHRVLLFTEAEIDKMRKLREYRGAETKAMEAVA